MKLTDISTIKIDSDNIKYYTNILYPKIELSEDDIYEDIPMGYRLDYIAFRYYNNPALWRLIALANNIGKGTMIIPGNMRIRIPDPNLVSKFIQDLENLNSR